jgi:8-oxo-dGTP diphosphatase
VIHVVRHAHAGSRSRWDRPDDERPLSEKGRLQAKSLGESLAAEGAGHLLSSPYLRCVETLDPLAASVGTTVETIDDLAEGNSGDAALALVRSLDDGSVLCSHGDVLQDLVWLLAASGAPVDPRIAFQKAAVLHLERDGSSIVAARYDPPPG